MLYYNQVLCFEYFYVTHNSGQLGGNDKDYEITLVAIIVQLFTNHVFFHEFFFYSF